MDDMPRAIRMAYEYLNGSTLSEIGDKYGVTRERARQIISKFGLGRFDGGGHLKAFERGGWMKKDPMDRFLNSYGCTKREALEINSGEKLTKRGTPAHRYKEQRFNAKYRGIEWKFTLPEWWSVWLDSGKWELRGRGFGYVMTRIGDTGPYEIGNVEIKTQPENSAESFLKHPQKERREKALAAGKKVIGFRKTHCIRGHELTTENRYQGTGSCLACRKIHSRKQLDKRKPQLQEAA